MTHTPPSEQPHPKQTGKTMVSSIDLPVPNVSTVALATAIIFRFQRDGVAFNERSDHIDAFRHWRGCVQECVVTHARVTQLTLMWGLRENRFPYSSWLQGTGNVVQV